jgi:hypothetical protein
MHIPNYIIYFTEWLVPMSMQSKACTVSDRWNTGTVGSNPAQGMDMCPHFSVSCCPV